MDAALERALESSLVHMYVCTLISRAAGEDAFADADTVSRDVDVTQKLGEGCGEGVNLVEPHLRSVSDALLCAPDVCSAASTEIEGQEDILAEWEEEPEDLIVFDACGETFASELEAFAAERCFEGTSFDACGGTFASELEAFAAERCFEGTSCSEAQEGSEVGPAGQSSRPSFQKLRKLGSFRREKERFAVAVRQGAVFVGDRCSAFGPSLSSTWNAIDETAERHAQQLEELVKLKAAVISDRSRATYEASYSTAETCSIQLEGRAAIMLHKSEELCKDFEAVVEDCVHRLGLESKIQSGADIMSSKADAVSKAARVVRAKTNELPACDTLRRGFNSARSKVKTQEVRRGFMRARGSVCEAMSGTSTLLRRSPVA